MFTRGGSKKGQRNNQSNNGEESKKSREGSFENSYILKSSALEEVSASSLKAPRCAEILISCMKHVENQLKEMIHLIKST